MRRRVLAFLSAAAVTAAAPAFGDDVEDALQAALDAYRAGDVKLAKEETDFAASLLDQRSAESLGDRLPAPLDGWTRQDDDSRSVGAAFMGGGMTASARYVDAAGADVEIALMADSPMIAAMSAMYENGAALGALGRIVRIGRQKAVVTQDDEIQTLVARRILVTVGGDAPLAAKEAYFAAIDFPGLAEF